MHDAVSGCLRAVRHVCSCARRRLGDTSGGGGGPLCRARSVFNYPSTPFRKKEREKETGPVQIDYSNHLEDSENERRGGRRKWDTTTSRGHSLCDTPTVQYDHCLRDA